MKNKVTSFPDASGEVNLFTRQWLPDEKPRGVIQGVHGINEHSGRYHRLGQYLSQRGFVLAMHDQRGHGLSIRPGERRGLLAETDGWTCLLKDIRQYGELLQEQFPDTPIFLLGHSMGSFAVRDTLLRWALPYAGVVLLGSASNPLWYYDLGLFLCGVGEKLRGRHYASRLLRNIIFGGYALPTLAGGSPMAWISRLPEVWRQYERDEFCRFIPSIGLFEQMFLGMREMDNPSPLPQNWLNMPLLILYGEKDPVGRYGKGMRQLTKRLQAEGAKQVTAIAYPGARHELLHEENTEEVLENLFAWLNRQVQA